jgi:hypothetical protein
MSSLSTPYASDLMAAGFRQAYRGLEYYPPL